MDSYKDFRLLLRTVDLYYDDFEHGIISYLKIPGNAYKQVMIEDFIRNNPEANSSDVARFVLEETDFWNSGEECLASQDTSATAGTM